MMSDVEFMVQVGAQGPQITQTDVSAAADVAASVLPAFNALTPPAMADVIARLLAEYLGASGRIRRLETVLGELASSAFGHILEAPGARAAAEEERARLRDIEENGLPTRH